MNARLLRMPVLPEQLIRLGCFDAFEKPLRALLPQEQLALYRRAWEQPGAPTGMINWYRALFSHQFGKPQSYPIPTKVSFISGDADPFLGAAAIYLSRSMGERIVTTLLPGRGHWLVHENPGAVSEAIAHFLDDGGPPNSIT
jgi:epoxide hydrolase 4